MSTLNIINPNGPSLKGLTAEEVFNSLDFYSRWTIATGGTAFTTYEELGPTEEKRLNELVKAWRVSLTGGE